MDDFDALSWHEKSIRMSGFWTHFRSFAEICPGAISTYNTAGRRDAIVSNCSPLLNQFMIKVSTQYAVNLVGILVGQRSNYC